jgi:hypothetical protein
VMKVQLRCVVGAQWVAMHTYAATGDCQTDITHSPLVTTGFHECSHATMSRHAMVVDTRCCTVGNDCALGRVIPILTLSSAYFYCINAAVALATTAS